MKKVVVIISTYNGEKTITRQLDSIFNQVDVSVEVLIRDDNSTDSTVDTIKKYIEVNPHCKIHIIEGNNVGFAKSFWLALKRSGDADYFAFSDQDDVWKSDKLIQCIKAMRSEENVPQLSYCKMQRSDIHLNRLSDQIKIVKPDDLTKKIALTTTYNYGAATVINRCAKELVCRTWPKADNVPHDLWIGCLCYWFGYIHFVDKELYYWIRYENSVTGEGTKKSGIMYRLRETLRKKSYPNFSYTILSNYHDLLSKDDYIYLQRIANYKHNLLDKIYLLCDFGFKRLNPLGTISLKIGILFNWF